MWKEAELASSPFFEFFLSPCPLNDPWCLASVCNEFGSTAQFRRHLQDRDFKSGVEKDSQQDSGELYGLHSPNFGFLDALFLEITILNRKEDF